MVKLLEFLDRHTARHLFRSSHLKWIVNLDFFFSIVLSGLRSTGIVGAEKNARSIEIRLGFGFC